MDYKDIQYAEAWSEGFRNWEQRGLGWDLFDVAVELEPAFAEPSIPRNSDVPVIDDARRPGGFGRLIRRRDGDPVRALEQNSIMPTAARQPPIYYRKEALAEIRLQLPRELDVGPAVSEQLLLSLGHFREPVGFELVADHNTITAQLACNVSFAGHFIAQWKSSLPDVTFERRDGFLAGQFDDRAPQIIADFGLSRSFLMPLRDFKRYEPDPMAGLISALASLTHGEEAALQVLFVPTRREWVNCVQRVIADADLRKILGEINPDYGSMVKDKFATPLFATSVRLIAQAGTFDRCWSLLRQIGGGLKQFDHPRGNELVALSSDGYSAANHRLSFLSRTNYRPGMLLSATELAGLVHVPSSSVQNPKLQRAAGRTVALPLIATGHSLILGDNVHDGLTTPATLSEDQRTRHVYIIGATGSGKSNLLLNCIKMDMEAGTGLCVIDPAGDLIDAVISNVPDGRMDDVILFDPADEQFPIPFNVLGAHTDSEKMLIASDVVAAFKRLSTSWGDVMDSVLANAVLAILESDRGGTLLDIKRLLVEKPFREDYIASIRDEAVRYFWRHEFPLIAGRPQASILIRLDAFLRQKLIRNIVCNKENKVDFRSIMDRKQILLIKLSQGIIGVENAQLLGTLLVTKIHQIGLSRQDTATRPFWAIYLDEFQNLVGPSVEPILSGIRKFNISLTLSHQEFRQLQSRSRDIAESVMANCYTRICFRLGDADAERFAGGFTHFDAADLKNLGIGQAIARVERADHDFNLSTKKAQVVDGTLANRRRAEVIQRSREKYAIPRTAAEEMTKYAPATPETGVGIHQPDPDRSVPAALESSSHPSANEHQYLKKLVKRIAQKYGFIATIEQSVLGGVGRVDVALDNGHVRVAVEVAVTNTVKYEIENIQKCLSAGFEEVVVLSSNASHLAEIREVAEATLSTAQLEKASFIEPANIHIFLERLGSREQVEGVLPKIKGYRVETSYTEASAAEAELIVKYLADLLVTGGNE